MTEALLAPSANAQSRATTAQAELDRAVATLKENARRFARLAVREKIALIGKVMAGLLEVSSEWVAASCRAKGVDAEGPLAGEEWTAGLMPTMRNLRLLAESLEDVRACGRPRLGGGLRRRAVDGRVEVKVVPASAIDGVLFAGFEATILLEAGVDERAAGERQAAFYQKRDPEGGVALILGAGNVSSIPPMDVFYKMFVEGRVCLLKMNPVNEWLGPFLERALAPLVEPGFVRIVYGAGDVGAYLVNHAGVDEVHITGSDKTHDMIVWGPPGPERERRKREGEPLLKKRITSELGNVSPVTIVPGAYTDDELWFQARNVASMVANNGSFNCNAGKVLVTSRGWAQRETFLGLVRKALGRIAPRKAYYPGAFDRYAMLTAGRAKVEKFGQPAKPDELPWALIPDVDPENKDEKLFEVEPFCGILSETALAPSDPIEFLRVATGFMNDRLWGTLNAMIAISPRDERDKAVAAALDRAIADLRYGTVAINHWPAIGYALVTPAWGGHQSATLANIQSGLGWVHNTFMLDGIEKSVVRGPITLFPKPPYFYDHRHPQRLGSKLLRLEARPSWLKVPGLALTAFLG